ncbi:hypothetical protein N7468_010497 [Penicillium chermesinum]|uniref:Uncharacterized protein n=1 Tax=Penicillium chermesinum TaxID=63820 RepID=A0A9W9T9T1_9EURO|nr:uncharacterized protein N7468_010497 [Penicillium chermesinum]KAJ5214818.1 hypothetical protein N7468_010497 [Penicillium chermesinum]
MQSHLTRRVFQALINNEPLIFSRCRNQLLYTSPSRVRLGLPNLTYTSRRTLFAFNTTANASGESLPEILPSEKGLKPMTDLKQSLGDQSRAPPNDILVNAFHLFFTSRVESPAVINLFQARLLSLTWKHLKAQQEDLTEKEWHDVPILPECRNTILKLARFVYTELCEDHGFGPNSITRPALILYTNLQANNGNPEEARHVLMKFGGQIRGAKPSPWLAVLKGYAEKDDQYSLRKVSQELESYGVKFDQESHQELVHLLISQGSFEAAKHAYECPIAGNYEPLMATKILTIKHAILNSEAPWAEPIFESLPQDVRETAGITLLWQAAHGSSATSLKQCVQEWTAGEPRISQALNIGDVNALLQYANSVRAPGLADEFFQLAEHWHLAPDEQTHILQLESFVQRGDVEQTLATLENKVDSAILASENLPLANKLITMLCLSEQKDDLFQQISSLLDPLFQDNVQLEAETVAALTRMLLYRHDWDAVTELLRPRLGTFDSEGKTLIRISLTDFILDMGQSDTDAWEVYQLLKLAFSETGVSVRTEIMSAFFERKRSDLGVLVFGHMRQAEDWAARPKPDTYARCFQGLARTADEKNLELVHNMLKLDLGVDLNTRILNGLMLAYAACEMPEKSMAIFRQILQSDEGPSEKTIPIFFKVCQNHPDGAQEALKMMAKVKKLAINLDRRLYTSYIEALAAQGEFDMATSAIDQMETETGLLPTSTTIGLFYNAMPHQYWKDEVEKWAREKYPQHWEHLAQFSRTEHEEGPKFDGITNEVIGEMASGLLFNPIRLLQVAPFASSTGTLVHATVELVTNSAFLLPSIRTQSDAIVPAWYETVFGKGVLSVLLLNLTTISTAAANLYLHRQRGGLQTTRFYWMGLVGAIGHLAFIPFVAGPVQRIIENKRYRESKGEKADAADSPTGQMAQWLAVHRVRMLVADLPAWIAFVGAVLTL